MAVEMVLGITNKSQDYMKRKKISSFSLNLIIMKGCSLQLFFSSRKNAENDKIDANILLFQEIRDNYKR